MFWFLIGRAQMYGMATISLHPTLLHWNLKLCPELEIPNESINTFGESWLFFLRLVPSSLDRWGHQLKAWSWSFSSMPQLLARLSQKCLRHMYICLPTLFFFLFLLEGVLDCFVSWLYKIAGQHSFNYPPSFLSRNLKRLVRSLVYLPTYSNILLISFAFSNFRMEFRLS